VAKSRWLRIQCVNHAFALTLYWFLGRPTLEDLCRDLRVITKKCRPYWDITTPEMKAAWQEGRKELFYPYGKTYAQTLGEQD
jgi:DNA-binding GntR family transcriptional regulator